MFLKRLFEKKLIRTISDARASENPWDSLQLIEDFIIENKTNLIKYTDLRKKLESAYLDLLTLFSGNLGNISRKLFLNLKEVSNIKIDETTPYSHLQCVYASNNISIKIINDILSKKNANHRALAIWRYIILAKMRFDAGDYQATQFILSALGNASINSNRLKTTYAGLPDNIVSLLKKLEFLSLQPDNVLILQNTMENIIPSPDRIKAFMTHKNEVSHSNDKEGVNTSARLTSKFEEKIYILQDRSRRETMAEEVHFFTFENIIAKHEDDVRDIHRAQYQLSHCREVRGKHNPRPTLFDNDFTPVRKLKLNLNVDKRLNALARKYLVEEKIVSAKNQISDEIKNLLEFLQTKLQQAQGLASWELQEVNHCLTHTKYQLESSNTVSALKLIEKNLIDLKKLHATNTVYFAARLAFWRKKLTIADKLGEIGRLIKKLSYLIKRNEILENKYKEKQQKRVNIMTIAAEEVVMSYQSEQASSSVSTVADVSTRLADQSEKTDSCLLTSNTLSCRLSASKKVLPLVNLFEEKTRIISLSDTAEIPTHSFLKKTNSITPLITLFNSQPLLLKEKREKMNPFKNPSTKW